MTDILERKLSPSPDAVESAVGNETVILHLVNGTYYGLDPVGTQIWASLKDGLSTTDICRQLAEEYGIELTTIEADARKFLSDLEAQESWSMAETSRFVLGDVLRATFELTLARTRPIATEVKAIINAPAQTGTLNRRQAELVERVAYVIPRIAVRLPWRADCLVQALAARRWLAREGISTTLKLGVLRDKPVEFEAHAWLTAGNRLVTGGDISGYVPLARP